MQTTGMTNVLYVQHVEGNALMQSLVIIWLRDQGQLTHNTAGIMRLLQLMSNKA